MDILVSLSIQIRLQFSSSLQRYRLNSGGSALVEIGQRTEAAIDQHSFKHKDLGGI